MTNILTLSGATKPSDETSDVATIVAKQRRSTPEIQVKIPLLFDLKTLPNNFKKRKKRGYDYYAYLVGLMVHKAEQRRLSYGTYFSFSSSVLRSLIGGDYNTYLKALINAGYIKEYSNPYSYHCKIDNITKHSKGTFKTGKSKRYSLNLDVIKQEGNKEILFSTYTISDKKIIDKINTQRVKNTQRVVESYPTAKRVYDSLKELSILDQEAKEYLHQKYDLKNIKAYGRGLMRVLTKNQLKKFISELQGTKSRRKLYSIFKSYNLHLKHDIKHLTREQHTDIVIKIRSLLSQYNSLNTRLHAIDKINNIAAGNYETISISRDHKTGRLFHTLTMIPKDLKPFVRLCGQPLIEIDGSNAQWFLLHGYIRNLCNVLEGSSILEKYNTNTINIIVNQYHIKRERIESTITPNSHNYTLHNFSTREDYSRYKERVERELYTLETMLKTNSFRNYFVEAYKNKGLELAPSKVKANLIKYILFGDVNKRYYHDATIVKLFKIRFPAIHQILVDLKTKYIDHDAFGYEMRDQWKCLALIMQSEEATIFVENMMFTDAVFATSHDAIVTNQANIHKVEKTLTEALKRANTKMSLDIKYWVKDYNDIQRGLPI